MLFRFCIQIPNFSLFSLYLQEAIAHIHQQPAIQNTAQNLLNQVYLDQAAIQGRKQRDSRIASQLLDEAFPLAGRATQSETGNLDSSGGGLFSPPPESMASVATDPQSRHHPRSPGKKSNQVRPMTGLDRLFTPGGDAPGTAAGRPVTGNIQNLHSTNVPTSLRSSGWVDPGQSQAGSGWQDLERMGLQGVGRLDHLSGSEQRALLQAIRDEFQAVQRPFNR